MAQDVVLANYLMTFRGKAQTTMVDGKPVKTIVKERENFSVQLPFLTDEGLAAILAGDDVKQRDAIRNACNNLIAQVARKQVAEGAKSQADLDMAGLSWAAVANMSASDLNETSAPTKEELEALAADYEAIMPAAVGISQDAAKQAAVHFRNKYRTVKLRDDMLAKLVSRLGEWYDKTANAEQHAETFEWLVTKAQNYIEEAQKANSNEMF